MPKYRVEHEFIYGWDDAGWHDGETGEPTLYDSYESAEAELDEFIQEANEDLEGEFNYSRDDFRIVEVTHAL